MKHPTSWWPNWLCLISQLRLTWGALRAARDRAGPLDFQGFGIWGLTSLPLYRTVQAPVASGLVPASLVETAVEDSSPRGTLASSGDGFEEGLTVATVVESALCALRNCVAFMPPGKVGLC